MNICLSVNANCFLETEKLLQCLATSLQYWH